jgi:hypothetical protein
MSGWIDRLPVDPLQALLAADDLASVRSVRHDLLREAPDPAALWERPAAASLLRRQHTDGATRASARRCAPRGLRPTCHLRAAAGPRRPAPPRRPPLGARTRRPVPARLPDRQGRPARRLRQPVHPQLHRRHPRRPDRGRLHRRPANRRRHALAAVDAPGRRRLDDPPPHTPHAADAQLRRRHATAAPACARPLAALLAPGHRHRRARARRPPAPPHATRDTRRLRATATRFFQPDRYPDRRAASYWEKLRYPFRWTDIVSALDAIALVGARHDEPALAGALAWLTDRQSATSSGAPATKKAHDPHIHEWVSFAIARVFRRIHDGQPRSSSANGEA